MISGDTVALARVCRPLPTYLLAYLVGLMRLLDPRIVVSSRRRVDAGRRRAIFDIYTSLEIELLSVEFCQ